MEFVAIIFALFMIAAAAGLAFMIGSFGGGWWAALGFAAFCVVIYRLSKDAPPDRRSRATLNAFQKELSDE